MIGEFFDPNASLAIRESIKPHWSQTGAIVFITIRTFDSIPREVLELWDRQRVDWLTRLGVLSGNDVDWRSAVKRLNTKHRNAFNRHFNQEREDCLDQCCGKCLLRDPSLAKIVADSLLKFDHVRYSMGDFVVMPNHFHLLASFPTEESMQHQCTAWMRFTATKINRQSGCRGHFWQYDPFDHLVRSLEQFEYLRRYIEDNPAKAHLAAGEYYYRRDQSRPTSPTSV
ncbi:transposase [Novipirellula maiorica]|nr:transposase [Rhodopirellula maiorica]